MLVIVARMSCLGYDAALVEHIKVLKRESTGAMRSTQEEGVIEEKGSEYRTLQLLCTVFKYVDHHVLVSRLIFTDHAMPSQHQQVRSHTQ